MTMSDASDREGRSRKRRRVENDNPNTLTTSISPPPLRRRLEAKVEGPKIMNSPFQLTHIRDLPNEANVDAVSLNDLLGDPLISECWEFNYLHDLDFLMEAFDPDVKDLVKVHVVHGFWKQEDQSRLNLKVVQNYSLLIFSLLFFVASSCPLGGAALISVAQAVVGVHSDTVDTEIYLRTMRTVSLAKCLVFTLQWH